LFFLQNIVMLKSVVGLVLHVPSHMGDEGSETTVLVGEPEGK
jgi:hypothetical protein